MTAPAFPAFDPDSADVAILEAYEEIRAARAKLYISEDEAALDETFEQDAAIRRMWAKTPAGVSAQISLALFDRGALAETEQTLFCDGLLSLYRKRFILDGQEQTLVTAAYELIHIEWQQALAAYEQNEADLAAVLALKSVVDAEKFRVKREGDWSASFTEAIDAQVEGLERRFGGNAPIDRLIRTLSPDFAAYQRKAQIAIEQDYALEAAPWMVRDVNFLLGATVPEQEAA